MKITMKYITILLFLIPIIEIRANQLFYESIVEIKYEGSSEDDSIYIYGVFNNELIAQGVIDFNFYIQKSLLKNEEKRTNKILFSQPNGNLKYEKSERNK